MRRWSTLVLLIVLASGCLGDRARESTEVADSAFDPPAVAARGNTEPESRALRFRIFDAGESLYSTWPNERGSLQDEPNAADTPPFHFTSESPLPPIFAPLRQEWMHGPAEGQTILRNVSVPVVEAETLLVPASAHLPIKGTLTEAEATALIGEDRTRGTFSFHGTIPIALTQTEEGDVAYEIEFDDRIEYRVPRTQGLFLVAERTETEARFTLSAPTGMFTSLGCQPLPGQILQAGHYEVRSDSGAWWTIAHYPTALDAFLQGKTIVIETTFIKTQGEST